MKIFHQPYGDCAEGIPPVWFGLRQNVIGAA